MYRSSGSVSKYKGLIGITNKTTYNRFVSTVELSWEVPTHAVRLFFLGFCTLNIFLHRTTDTPMNKV